MKEKWVPRREIQCIIVLSKPKKWKLSEMGFKGVEYRMGHYILKCELSYIISPTLGIIIKNKFCLFDIGDLLK